MIVPNHFTKIFDTYNVSDFNTNRRLSIKYVFNKKIQYLL